MTEHAGNHWLVRAHRHRHTLSRLALGLMALAPAAMPLAAQGDAWPAWGRDPGGSRYAPLRQITRDNVAQLEVVWTHRTGDYLPGRGRFQATPIFVDGTLFVSTPLGRVDALDPATGARRWTWDADLPLDGPYPDWANRGVSYWRDAARPDQPCGRRVFVATVDARLIALDAVAGRPCDTFGLHGTVDLALGVAPAPDWRGEYGVTSPPAIVHDLVIVGSAVTDNQRAHAPSGVVRAFDARSGTLAWSWDPVPREPGDPAWASWRDGSAARTGAANAWSIMSVDSARGLLFVPTGSPSPDFYGGERRGANRYANSVVALRAATGDVVWSYQVVHHDIWDYDVPAQPVLFEFRRGARRVPAVAVATKMGHVFVLDRTTGVPLHPVEERAVPASDVAGEEAWPTQPFPTVPAPLAPQYLAADSAFGLTPEDRAACRDRIAQVRNEGIFTPPSLRGTLLYPGNLGGSNWGGLAVDLERGVLVGAANRLPFIITLMPRDSAGGRDGRERGPQRGTPYVVLREVFLRPPGVPCGPPPWSTLTAIDAGTGARVWEVPFGYVPDLADRLPEARAWGSVTVGGPVITAGGLVFMAGTFDGHLRAFDIENGRELWHGRLPVPAFSTPMTYEVGGRQYVVVVAGGHDRLPVPGGDYVVAFALPDRSRPPGASAADVVGRWTGEVRVSQQRFTAVLDLEIAGTGLTGRLEIANPEVHGQVTGFMTGNDLRLEIRFRNVPAACGGAIQVSAVPLRDTMDGTLEVRSTCGAGVERGSFAMRRAVTR